MNETKKKRLETARVNIPIQSTGFAYIQELMTLYSGQAVVVPTRYRDQINAIDRLLKNDSSGLINSLLDFAVDSATTEFSVESSNDKLSDILDKWLANINKELIGKIPVGISALAKEYYKERWKGSSFILLRSIWGDVNGFYLPVRMWFVDGKDIAIEEDDNPTRILGNQSYGLMITKDNIKHLPASKDEKIFVQKPYENWGSDYPTPFIIKRGIFKNAKILELMIDKGSSIVDKALEYLFLMKKGNAELAKLGRSEFTYSDEDLKAIRNDFSSFLGEKKTVGGVPAYLTQFDTEMEHIIPEYERAMKSELYVPSERRILAGLGFIEVLEGITSSRKDSVLNPKLFISEVNSGIKDFKCLLTDIITTILEENKLRHKKYSNVEMIQIRSAPVKNFMSDDYKNFLRSVYDRGNISKRTLTEIGVDVDFDSEIEIRRKEKSEGVDEVMFPPVVTNTPDPIGTSPDLNPKGKQGPKNTPIDKTGPEKRNFKG